MLRALPTMRVLTRGWLPDRDRSCEASPRMPRGDRDEHEPLLPEPLLPEAVSTRASGVKSRDSRLRWLYSLLRDQQQQPGAGQHDGSEASASAAHPSLQHRKVMDKKRCARPASTLAAARRRQCDRCCAHGFTHLLCVA